MVIHFVNLVGWRSCLYSAEAGDEVFFDSVSIVWLAWVFGFRIRRRSGVSAFREFDGLNCLRLISQESDKRSGQTDLVLDRRDFFHDDITDIVRFVASKQQPVLIGISSPTQNVLGRRLDLELGKRQKIVCLGAAMYQGDKSLIISDRLGLSWLRLGLNNPKRFVVKVLQTAFAILLILSSNKERSEFRRLCEIAASCDGRDLV